MAAREIHDEVHQPGQRAHRRVHQDETAVCPAQQRRLARLEAEGAGDVVRGMRAAADQEGDHQHDASTGGGVGLRQLGLVVEEPGDHFARDAAGGAASPRAAASSSRLAG